MLLEGNCTIIVKLLLEKNLKSNFLYFFNQNTDNLIIKFSRKNSTISVNCTANVLTQKLCRNGNLPTSQLQLVISIIKDKKTKIREANLFREGKAKILERRLKCWNYTV